MGTKSPRWVADFSVLDCNGQFPNSGEFVRTVTLPDDVQPLHAILSLTVEGGGHFVVYRDYPPTAKTEAGKAPYKIFEYGPSASNLSRTFQIVLPGWPGLTVGENRLRFERRDGNPTISDVVVWFRKADYELSALERSASEYVRQKVVLQMQIDTATDTVVSESIPVPVAFGDERFNLNIAVKNLGDVGLNNVRYYLWTAYDDVAKLIVPPKEQWRTTGGNFGGDPVGPELESGTMVSHMLCEPLLPDYSTLPANTEFSIPFKCYAVPGTRTDHWWGAMGALFADVDLKTIMPQTNNKNFGGDNLVYVRKRDRKKDQGLQDHPPVSQSGRLIRKARSSRGAKRRPHTVGE